MREIRPILSRFRIRLLIAVVVALVVTEYGGIDALFRRLLTAVFYQEYLSTLFITIIVMETVHRVNGWLGNQHPWEGGILYRLILQIAASLVLPALLVFLLAAAYFAIYGLSIYDTDYMVYAYPFILSLITTLNLLYIFVPYFLQAIQPGETGVGPVAGGGTNGYSSSVLLHKGPTSVPLPVDEVACIFISDRNVLVRTFSKEDYLTTFTLDELESTLDPAKFCRLNRQLIGHIKACKSYESLDYGKLLMHMEPAPDIATTVSQLKAPLVRKWMQDGNG